MKSINNTILDNVWIRMTQHSYNTYLEQYRRHTSPDNLDQVQTAYKEYTKLGTHVRNLYWNQQITDCNNSINSSEIWRRIKAQQEQRRGPLPTIYPRNRKTHYVTPLYNDGHRKTTPEDTINTLTQMVSARVRAITTAAYELVDTDMEFTLSELEDILYRLKDTVPGDDTVCYSMIKNAPLATRNLFRKLINQSFTEGKLPTKGKMTKSIPIPKKDKTHRPISLLPAFSKVMDRLVLTRVKWSTQSINQYRAAAPSILVQQTRYQHLSTGT